jgi:Holliday junction resolvasome RuvABC endonuclease subunit
MIIMGIDPSINCTGVCVYNTLTGNSMYYMIVGKITKKMSIFKNDFIQIRGYDKQLSTNDEYSIKEAKKTTNINSICDIIKDIIHWHEPEYVYMEGISYGSVSGSSLADLAGLNHCIRMTLIDCNVDYTILAPTAVKKFAVGNGSAEKDVIIASWKKLDKNISNISEIKLDDLADSFFIAHYEQ